MTVFSGIIPTSNILSHYLHFSLWFENMRLYPKISTILFSLLLPPKLFSNIAKPNDWFLFFWVSASLHSLVHPIHDIYTSNLGLHTKFKYLPAYFGISRCVLSVTLASQYVPQLRKDIVVKNFRKCYLQHSIPEALQWTLVNCALLDFYDEATIWLIFTQCFPISNLVPFINRTLILFFHGRHINTLWSYYNVGVVFWWNKYSIAHTLGNTDVPEILG